MVLCTPPCSSFSRVMWSNNNGPQPIRSASHPEGYPWLRGAEARKAHLGNTLVNFLWKVCSKVEILRKTQRMVAFAEHPEDLGEVTNGRKGTPASIWRMSEFRRLLEQGWWSGAFRQCDFDAPTPKPTRCLASSEEFVDLAKASTPSFKKDGSYEGPVQRCTHNHTESLTRTSVDTGDF